MDLDIEIFSKYVRDYAASHPQPLNILEAGCGRRWGLDMTGIDFRLVGVDINAESLRLRREVVGDLDLGIVGDLRTVSFPMRTFDIAYCSFLLEHIEGAEAVLDRLLKALKPGGLLLLRMPDRDSIYGFAARHTPHRSHVWYKRHLRGAPHAGEPGYGPFPVVYDPIVSLRGMSEFLSKRGLTVLHLSTDNSYVKKDFKAAAPLVSAVFRGIAMLSRDRLTADHNNLAYVIRGKGSLL